MLFISDMECCDERSDKNIYSSHMTKTLVLIIAAIHLKRTNIFSSTLPPPSLTPPQSARLSLKKCFPKAAICFGATTRSMAWESLLGCWTWVSYINYETLPHSFVCDIELSYHAMKTFSVDVSRASVIYIGNDRFCTQFTRAEEDM
jgi:hypothetical protein